MDGVDSRVIEMEYEWYIDGWCIFCKNICLMFY